MAHVFTGLGGALDQAFLFNHVDGRHPHRCLERARGEGVEVARAFAESVDQLRRRDDARERKAVPHRLAERDDVGLERRRLIAPPASSPSETRLDLVADEESTGFVDQLRRARHESGRDLGQALVGQDGTEQEGGEPGFARFKIGDAAANLLDVEVEQLLISGAVANGAVALGEGEAGELGGVAVTQPGELAHFGAIAVVGGGRNRGRPYDPSRRAPSAGQPRWLRSPCR